MPDRPTLYHFTCHHARARIGDSGTLIAPIDQELAEDVSRWPAWQQTLLSLIWMTDLAEPARDGLGLTSKHIDCDRTVHRYRVAAGFEGASHWPQIRRDLPAQLRTSLEQEMGVLPMHWWISTVPVPVVYDPISTVGRSAGGVPA